MRSLVFLFCLSFGLFAYGQKTVTVSGEYTYHAPENISLEQARNTAIERARLEAIAKEFGTDVSQTNTVSVSNHENQSDAAFHAFASTEIKGEWIADTKEPVLTIRYEEGMLVITATVWGKIRKKEDAGYDLSIKVLCNGIESERFKNNDRLAVRFKSPVSGFLAIYLADDRLHTAYCLLPYENEEGKVRAVKHNTEYTLLSTADPTYPFREETIVTASRSVEFNRLIFVFSTEKFFMPLTEEGVFHPELSLADFERWLQRNRIKDRNLSVIERSIEIKN